jgi:hypothetical protein
VSIAHETHDACVSKQKINQFVVTRLSYIDSITHLPGGWLIKPWKAHNALLASFIRPLGTLLDASALSMAGIPTELPTCALLARTLTSASLKLPRHTQ